MVSWILVLRAISVSLLLSVSLSNAATSLPKKIDFRRSVVKIYTIYNSYNFHEPWQMKGQQARQGSGCVISGKRILTNTHVVSDATFIEVRRSGHSRRYTAKVKAVGHDSDLAILTVEDPEFFIGSEALEIGELPNLEDEVTVYGFPEGGDKLSVTKGVVSRVEHVNYEHSGAYLLACQIDAPINAGNSGGPVVFDGKIVGVAFQGLPSAQYENIGYMVPAPVIKRFLKDISDGTYDGVPDLGLSMQKMENPDIQNYYGLSKGLTGVLVTRISPGSPAEGILQKGDIIVKADGMDIANDGTIEFRPGERTYFGYVFQNKQIGDNVNLDILRNRSLITVSLTLNKPIDFDRLVPNDIYDTPPSYFILGGLVFERLVLNYLKEYGAGEQWILNAPTLLMNFYENGFKEQNRLEIVVLVKVLADSSNKGYHAFVDDVISKVNGKRIATLKDLVKYVESAKGPYLKIEDILGHEIVLNRTRLKSDTKKILKKYKIPFDRSPDLRLR